MANLFYGVSATSAGANEKEVIIYNPLQDNIVVGDLLAVYFANGNTKETPTLVVRGTSLSNGEDNQTALSEDAGIFIKTRNAEAEVDYMWQAGEVCLFVLVSQQDNSDITQEYSGASQDATNNDTLYYMLVRGARANSEYYGLTKLFTDNFETGRYRNFQEWLAADDVEEDKVTAATPYLVKQLSEFLIGKIEAQEDESESESGDESEGGEGSDINSFINIVYNSVVEEGGILIGTLTTPSGDYQIKIPQQTSEGGSSGGIAIHENTSDVRNDADIVPGDNNTFRHNRKEPDENYTLGTYFITNVVDGGIYLHNPQGEEEVGIYIADKTITGNTPDGVAPVEGGLSIKSLLKRDEYGNITLNEGFFSTPLYIYGKPISFQTKSNRETSLRLDNTISAQVSVSAPEYIEGNKSLKVKYAHALTVLKVRLGEGASKTEDAADTSKISYSVLRNGTWTHVGRKRAIYQKGGGVTGHKYIRIAIPGYRPLGIVGYNISYASTNSGYTAYDDNNRKITANNSDASYQILWELNLTPQTSVNNTGYGLINYDTRNTKSGQVGFIIDTYVLCEAIY